MTPPSSTQVFSAPWGRAVKVVSALATTLLLGVPAMGLLALPAGPPLARWPTILLPLLVLAGAALFAVRGFKLENRCLVVRRLCWNTHIPLDGLQSAATDAEAMEASLRLFGNGGLFACTGLFRNRRLGTYRAFVTDPSRCVVLRLPKRPIVVSPDRPEEFVRAAQTAAGLA